jgi:ribosomal protein S18 acetylase RimI-like enzyme
MPRTCTLEPLRISEIPEVGALARGIWRQHYASIISSAQIEYMLRNKYTPMDLERYVGAPDRWFDVLRVENTSSGFLRTSRASQGEFKLEEIYVVAGLRGKGYGKLLLDRAEALAREQHCRKVFLFVNRANEGSIAAYLRNGFMVRESKVFDIGHGFVMDDYLMEKSLAA